MKTIIITGGASGLGKNMVSYFSKNGEYKVVVFDINKNVQKDFKNTSVELYCVDVTKEEQVVQGVDEVFKKFGKIDVLVNNAGAIYNEALINLMDSEDIKHKYENFSNYLSINLDSVFLVGSNVAAKMVENRTKGVIINMSSIAANGNVGQSAYSAAKAGVNALTKTWSKELGRFGIRVVSISPGFIDTKSTNEALSENTIKHIKSNTPLRRMGKPNNISSTVKFIIDNDFITGTVVEIDGGLEI
jgi:3-oxoacyl-[acyl-carrier protein] reductase